MERRPAETSKSGGLPLTEKTNIIPQVLQSLFAGQLVRVDTPAGSFVGFLKNSNRLLLLEDPNGWLLIKNWISIKRRLPADLQPRFCRDCEEATVHSTGSQLWVSCRLVDGWRPINSECVLRGNR